VGNNREGRGESESGCRRGDKIQENGEEKRLRELEKNLGGELKEKIGSRSYFKIRSERV